MVTSPNFYLHSEIVLLSHFYMVFFYFFLESDMCAVIASIFTIYVDMKHCFYNNTNLDPFFT